MGFFEIKNLFFFGEGGHCLLPQFDRGVGGVTTTPHSLAASI